jgi:hypothetical protein
MSASMNGEPAKELDLPTKTPLPGTAPPARGLDEMCLALADRRLIVVALVIGNVL